MDRFVITELMFAPDAHFSVEKVLKSCNIICLYFAV